MFKGSRAELLMLLEQRMPHAHAAVILVKGSGGEGQAVDNLGICDFGQLAGQNVVDGVG